MIHPQLNSVVRLTAVIALAAVAISVYFMPQDNGEFKLESQSYHYQHTTLGRAQLSSLFF